MPNLTGSVTETDRYGCDDGDLGLPDKLLCCSIFHTTENKQEKKISINKKMKKEEMKGKEKKKKSKWQNCNYRSNHGLFYFRIPESGKCRGFLGRGGG